MLVFFDVFLQRIGAMDILKVILKNSEITTLSLDIFDTILLRDGKSEEYHFYNAAQKIVELHKNESATVLSVKTIYLARVFSHQLCYRNYNLGLSSEPTIDKILEIQQTLIPTIKLEILIEAELQNEIESLSLNIPLYNQIKEAQRNGKIIVFLSDMYLTSVYINKLLRAHRVELDYTLYVSSEIGVSKHRNNAYSWLISTLNSSAKSILHVGDNYQTDIFNAEQIGISTFHTPRSRFFHICHNIRKTTDKLLMGIHNYASRSRTI